MKFNSGFTYRNFMDYFSNKLEKKDKHAFEKKMMQDDFDSEAFDGLSKISSQEFEQDFAELKNQIHARTKERKRRIPIWFPYAASIAIVMGLGSVLMYLNQYSAQDELIGDQMEREVKKIELPLVTPELPAKESELLDLVDTIEEDLELEISDSEDFTEEEFAVVEEAEEEEEDEIFSKSEIISEAPVVHKEMSVKRIAKSSAVNSKSTADAEKALSGKVAGIEVHKSKKQDESLSFFTDSASKDINRMISGVVLDEDKVPIPGVQIISKETGEGVVTNMDGQFQIRAKQAGKKYKLTASFIGYEQKEVDAKPDSTLLVILEPDNTSLDEVVVVAYGTEKRKSVTGSVTEIKTDDESSLWEKARPVNSESISNFEKALINKLDYSKFEHLHGAYKVKLSFVVNTSGAIEDLVFKDNPDSVLTSEIRNLILNGETWQAAKSKEEPVSSKVRIVLKIHFE